MRYDVLMYIKKRLKGVFKKRRYVNIMLVKFLDDEKKFILKQKRFFARISKRTRADVKRGDF